MKKQKEKRYHNRMDKCIKPLIKWLKDRDYNTVASCCGHGKYPITVVVKYRFNGKEKFFELFSYTDIPRKRKFYQKDNEGYYCIPEVMEVKK